MIMFKSVQGVLIGSKVSEFLNPWKNIVFTPVILSGYIVSSLILFQLLISIVFSDWYLLIKKIMKK